MNGVSKLVLDEYPSQTQVTYLFMPFASKIAKITAAARVANSWPLWLLQRLGLLRRFHSPLLFRLRNKAVLEFLPDHHSLGQYFQETWVDHCYTKYRDIAPDDIVIDVGASIGGFTVYAATRAPRVRVYALEPDPALYSFLARNIDLNALAGRVSASTLAIGSTSGQRAFSLTTSSFSDISSLPAATELRTVFTETLTHLLQTNNIAHCDFLKMDVEGAEFEILLNTSEETLKRIGYIAMEYHRNPDTLVAYLGSLGYALTDIPTHNGCGYLYADRQAPLA